MELPDNQLKCLNFELTESLEAKLVPDAGRIYYIDHKTQSSSWLPPRDNWDPGNSGLPYGWEGAVDKNNKPYFINHIENYTTRDDPRDDPDYVEPPKPRDVELVRDALKGFGFVAGSEKPVVVRFVTEGGPSVDKLLPGDQLIKINGQDVKKAPREFVIDLVRSCKQTISLTVCQPYNDNGLVMINQSARKSALLTAAKKDRLKKNPSRVRFAENIIVNGASIPSNSPEESYVPFMPNVLKVFLENGQTKSFKYDNKTTVKDVMCSLQEKLSIKCVQHFNLVLHNMKSHVPGRMTLLQEHEMVAEIASRPGARHFRCLFRVVYVPRDSYDLLKEDPIAFEYFYMQCVNDVVQERFSTELKVDTILRLSALHIQQHAMSNSTSTKINLKAIEKEFGYEKFVPQAIRDSMRVKDLRKVLSQSLKLNQNLTAPGQKQLTALQAKLHYMKIVSELKTFGSRVFMVTLLDKRSEAMVLVGPKSGISLVTNIRFYTGNDEELNMLADFGEIECVKVAREKDNMNRVELTIKGDEPGTLNLGLLKEETNNFVSMVNGYFKIFVDPNHSLLVKNAGRQSDDPDIPPYEGKHVVITAPWSYPDDIVTTVISDGGDHGNENERIIDLTHGPPAYEGNEEYIKKLKTELGIEAEDIPEKPEDRKTDDEVDASGKVSPIPMDEGSSVSLKTKHSTEPEPEDESKETSSPPIKRKREFYNSPVLVKKDSRVTSPDQLSPRTPLKTVITIDTEQSKSRSRPGTGGTHISVISSQTVPSNRTESHKTRTNVESDDTKFSESKSREPVRQNGSPEKETINSEIERTADPVGGEVLIKQESGENNSDTDSGVGGETEKQIILINNPVVMERQVSRESSDTDSWGTPTENPMKGTGLESLSDLHLDLSSLNDPMLSMMPVEEIEPATPTTPDPESTSFCPFDADHLPQEILDGIYDPRLFHQADMYFDPDIIDLTLLPPYPPTIEEITEQQQQQEQHQQHHGQHKSTSERKPTPRHPHLTKASSVIKHPSSMTEDQQPHNHIQKSASLGYCPDFLDSDIDAFIDKLTVRPPPSEHDKHYLQHEGVEEVFVPSDPLSRSWDEAVWTQEMDEDEDGELGEGGGLEFGNVGMSKTIDLGVLALDDKYADLVIPPPPDESVELENIAIVPPVSSVNEKRKKFHHKRSSSMDTFVKLFGSSKDKEDELSKDGAENSNDVNISSKVDSKKSDVTGNSGKADKPDQSVSDSSENKMSAKDESPASVSEKLNELLKSLSLYDSAEEEAESQFRRTSSLRLGRSGSLDLLPTNNSTAVTPKSISAGKMATSMTALQTGSVRVKSRSRGSLERVNPFLNGKSIPSPMVPQNGQTNKEPVMPASSTHSNIPRNHSDNQLLSSDSEKDQSKTVESKESKPSETFAALKAKLQSYRDSLLSKSSGRKTPRADDNSKTSSDETSADNTGSSLRRSSSFTQLFQKSRSRSGSKDTESKEGRSSSATRDSGKESETRDGPVGSSRDRKIWNTLASTPRSKIFRPNVVSITVQEPITSKSPLLGKDAPVGQVENNSKKAGPLKALSHIFDGEKKAVSPAAPVQSGERRTPKRAAPEVPNTPPAIPHAPPRRKHAPSIPTSASRSSDRKEMKTKDDSDLFRSPTPSQVVKTNPYATVGKMWRPMSMTSSATIDTDLEESFRSYNNFDMLRDLSSGRSTPARMDELDQLQTFKLSNGHLETNNTDTPSSSTLRPDSNFISDQSIALLKEKVSANHSDCVKKILDTVYTSEDFEQATHDVDQLLVELRQTMDSLKTSRIERKQIQFKMCKEELQTRVRQFVTDAKLLVSNATQTKQKLAINMDSSIHSLAKIFLHAQATMIMMEAIHQAQHLGSEVMRVANSYKSTLNAANAAVGKPLADPHMKYLMRQATNLATLLSNLLKSLKSLEQR